MTDEERDFIWTQTGRATANELLVQHLYSIALATGLMTPHQFRELMDLMLLSEQKGDIFPTNTVLRAAYRARVQQLWSSLESTSRSLLDTRDERSPPAR